jgi:hypothetical protein
VSSFWRDLRKRAEHLLLLVAYSTAAVGFLGAFFLGTAWLRQHGYGVVADILFLNYLFISLPIFLAQLGVLVDLMFTLLGAASVVLPELRAVSDRVPAGPVIRTVAGVLTTVSLFSSVSTWALSLVVPPASALDLARLKHRTEAGVFAATLERIKRRA